MSELLCVSELHHRLFLCEVINRKLSELCGSSREPLLVLSELYSTLEQKLQPVEVFHWNLTHIQRMGEQTWPASLLSPKLASALLFCLQGLCAAWDSVWVQEVKRENRPAGSGTCSYICGLEWKCPGISVRNKVCGVDRVWMFSFTLTKLQAAVVPLCSRHCFWDLWDHSHQDRLEQSHSLPWALSVRSRWSSYFFILTDAVLQLSVCVHVCRSTCWAVFLSLADGLLQYLLM